MARNGKQIGRILAALVLVLLVAAWINGGKEPLHMIEEPVALPGAGR